MKKPTAGIGSAQKRTPEKRTPEKHSVDVDDILSVRLLAQHYTCNVRVPCPTSSRLASCGVSRVPRVRVVFVSRSFPATVITVTVPGNYRLANWLAVAVAVVRLLMYVPHLPTNVLPKKS